MIAWLERAVFSRRGWVLGLFALVTVFMAYSASSISIDAGFTKLLPLEHPFMRTFVLHQQFGGANRVLIALMARDGEIFTPQFFEALREATDEVFFVPGVDRATVTSVYTPNVRFTEVVEDGIAGGNVVPDDFQLDDEGLERVRENILKAGLVGRLVANDFSGAIISAQLLEFHPTTGEPLDYIEVAHELEEKIRARFDDTTTGSGVDVRIIGFARIIGDIAQGAARVVLFFGVAFLITAVFVYIYTHSSRLTLTTLACSLIAVTWQLGLLNLLGYGIDPMGILVPFLVFAIGVSHGVQMVSAYRAEIFLGRSPLEAARTGFRRLLIPGGVALLSDTIGFLTILLIDIRMIQELAISASLGVATIILTNLFLLPVLLSFVHLGERYRSALQARAEFLAPFWEKLSRVTRPAPAGVILAGAVVLLGVGSWKAASVEIGDLHSGVPELRSNSRYNVDGRVIAEHFSIGVDILSVIAETVEEGCIDHEIMQTIDDFTWHMRNVPGIQSVIALPTVAKRIHAGWNEGSLKWRSLPRNPSAMAQSIAYVPTDSGLLNEDCSVMPVLMFTGDHKADTIVRIVDAVRDFDDRRGSDRLRFRLATGNVGVMAATNEVVAAAQFPILAGVFSAVLLLCLLTFRSPRAVICIVAPLALVSLLGYALMAMLEIGLKVSTLPVVALGVGVGVDYGIYVYSRLRWHMAEGMTLDEAYRTTLDAAGSGVLLTGLTLAVGVGTWIFAPLKFQADMGVLLTFMFLVNMLGAILLLPALARLLGVASAGLRPAARGPGPRPESRP